MISVHLVTYAIIILTRFVRSLLLLLVLGRVCRTFEFRFS